MLNFDNLVTVASHVSDSNTLSSLALTSRLINEAVTPQLYRHITFRIRNDADKLPAIFKTFQTRPELKLHVHHVEQIGPECYNVDPDGPVNFNVSEASWIQFLEGLSNLREYALRPWSHMGFMPANRARAALAALRRSGARLHTLSLDFEGLFLPSSFEFCSASLRRLELNMIGMEADGPHPVLVFCTQCPKLEHVKFVGLRPMLFLPDAKLGLTSFTVGPRYAGFQFKDLVLLLQHMPNLKCLDLFSYFSMENFPNPADEQHEFPRLCSLTIRYYCRRDEVTNTYFAKNLYAWTHLLVKHTSPQSLVLRPIVHIGISGNFLVSNITTTAWERLVCLRIPYMDCNESAVHRILASAPHLNDLSLAVKGPEALAVFCEPKPHHKPPLRILALYCWIPKSQAQADDIFARDLFINWEPHLTTFIADGKRKWQSRWVMEGTHNGTVKREIHGPEPYDS